MSRRRRAAICPSANLVFVQSRDGNTVTQRPVRRSAAALADKHLIYEGLSRVAADAVLAGSRTIANGGLVLSVWRPELVALRAAMDLPRHPVQIVATLQGLDARRGADVQRAGGARDPDHRRRAAPTRCATR